MVRCGWKANSRLRWPRERIWTRRADGDLALPLRNRRTAILRWLHAERGFNPKWKLKECLPRKSSSWLLGNVRSWGPSAGRLRPAAPPCYGQAARGRGARIVPIAHGNRLPVSPSDSPLPDSSAISPRKIISMLSAVRFPRRIQKHRAFDCVPGTIR